MPPYDTVICVCLFVYSQLRENVEFTGTYIGVNNNQWESTCP